MQLELNSAETLRINFHLLTPQQIAQLVADDVLSIAYRAAINSDVNWRYYMGRVDLQAYYRGYGEEIAAVAPYTTIHLTPEIAQEVALLIMSRVPYIVELMVAANGGVMPPVLPPLAPPVPEPEPSE